MDTQKEQEQGKSHLTKPLAYAGGILGFVMLVAYAMAGNVNLTTMAQVAEFGPGLYAGVLQVPQT